MGFTGTNSLFLVLYPVSPHLTDNTFDLSVKCLRTTMSIGQMADAFLFGFFYIIYNYKGKYKMLRCLNYI